MEETKMNKKLKFKEFQDKYFGLENKFEFDNGNWKNNGIIFVSASLIFPYLITLIIYLAFQLPAERLGEDTSNYQLVSQLLQLISIGVGFIVLLTREKGYFMKGKGWFFLYSVAPIICAILLGVVLRAIMQDPESKFAINVANALIMLVATGLVMGLILGLDTKFRANLVESLKKHFWPILIVGVIGFVILFAVNIQVGLLERLWAGEDGSANQNAIVDFFSYEGATSQQKVIYALLIGSYVVIIAPFIEEAIFRYVWNLNTSNRWLGFVTGSIYFGFLHYGTTGDFAHALSYTAAGFVFGGIFLFTNGNTAACWIAHFLNNAISFSIVIGTVNWG